MSSIAIPHAPSVLGTPARPFPTLLPILVMAFPILDIKKVKLVFYVKISQIFITKIFKNLSQKIIVIWNQVFYFF